MVNGFLPCGLVYSALSIPIAIASPSGGALAMVAFGAGTVPALAAAALAFRRITTRSLFARRLVAALVLLAGLGSIALRSGWIGSGHHHH